MEAGAASDSADEHLQQVFIIALGAGLHAALIAEVLRELGGGTLPNLVIKIEAALCPSSEPLRPS